MNKYIIAGLTAFLFFSCEKSVTVNIPDTPSKLVVNSLVQNNNVFVATIGKTESILSPANTSSAYKVENAFVQLYQNNVLIDTLVYNLSTQRYRAKNNTRATINNNYLLKVAAPNFTTAEGETITPSLVTIQSLSRKVNAKQDASGRSLDEIKLSFFDNGSETNFYLIRVKRAVYEDNNVVQYENAYCIKTNDIDVDRNGSQDPTDFESCFYKEFYMKDKNFNGKVKEITFYADSYEVTDYTATNGKIYKPIVEVLNLSENFYKYRKSSDTYFDNYDNPFAEPVLIFSNIKNGFGIFSAFSQAKDTIR